ncbi:DUF1707 domain-containing protein [Corynebacterium sp.]|uniref:DUF1707 SHOCT-like domain-containing protein n=1 Tax=Corynebacterium sp. TaxID=1720 RepID=UPI002A9151AB|nr:DUF1707 domain-containing protein [Corynebacterium sp.]MDY5785547.1 DUF1707 domain-containing protein [Corynebacterium sp.]
MSTPYGRYRLSNTERNHAMSALSNALGEGRITMEEFDQRCTAIAQATFQSDLEPVFSDIPQCPTPTTAVGLVGPVPVPVSATGEDVQLYSSHEIVAARRDGQKMRAGAFWLGTIGAMGVSVAAAAFSGTFTLLPLFIIPTLFILLYVMKVGPDSWYTPSIRQLEKKRRQLVRIQQLEIEAAHAREIAEQRAQRRQQVTQLTDDVIGVAHQTVRRFRKK